jgi:hypothetical protein
MVVHSQIAAGAPRATAKQVFDEVAKRLQVDPLVLSYLFGECLVAIIAETEKTGSCTLRGLGRFKKSPELDLGHLLFERTKHSQKHTPFAAWSLKKRMTVTKR